MIRAFDDAGTEEKSFDIIATVKLRHQCADLLRCKGGARQIIVTIVLAVGAVINTVVGHEYFQ